jgi:hypothetical protein
MLAKLTTHFCLDFSNPIFSHSFIPEAPSWKGVGEKKVKGSEKMKMKEEFRLTERFCLLLLIIAVVVFVVKRKLKISSQNVLQFQFAIQIKS